MDNTVKEWIIDWKNIIKKRNIRSFLNPHPIQSGLVSRTHSTLSVVYSNYFSTRSIIARNIDGLPLELLSTSPEHQRFGSESIMVRVYQYLRTEYYYHPYAPSWIFLLRSAELYHSPVHTCRCVRDHNKNGGIDQKWFQYSKCNIFRYWNKRWWIMKAHLGLFSAVVSYAT